MRIEKALLKVDVQNDFCPGGSLAVKHGNKVVPVLNALTAHARARGWVDVASRDWHPAVTRHFKKHNPASPWPDHCVQGTKGAEFVKKLDVRDSIVISKGTGTEDDGYSPFEGRAENGFDLEQVLRAKGVEKIVIGGLATDYCVKAAVLDALKLRFKVILVLDACRAVNLAPHDGEKAIAEMARAGAVVKTLEEVLSND